MSCRTRGVAQMFVAYRVSSSDACSHWVQSLQKTENVGALGRKQGEQTTRITK